MASNLVKSTARTVKPLLSLDQSEAKRRALNLYKAWYRQIPQIVKLYDIPVSAEQARAKLREEYVKNKHVRDIRAIDLLVIKVTTSTVMLPLWEQSVIVASCSTDVGSR
ncbi:hypothetical protein HPB49_022409 [Dermacentor silvarum]|uniref:Uncharacterized protein n=1 Tax=Dermacentor silvarum TaxID=543639 RepID=A0ACB8CTH4_DERSI|nr:hypothetical protein HPB49_022409 [Dermacentor silvarum]